MEYREKYGIQREIWNTERNMEYRNMEYRNMEYREKYGIQREIWNNPMLKKCNNLVICISKTNTSRKVIMQIRMWSKVLGGFSQRLKENIISKRCT